VSCTCALVKELTLTEPTVIPEPKLAVVTPCAKCVLVPVTVTVTVRLWPCWPLLLTMDEIAAGPAVIVKPLVRVTISPLVVRVTLFEPVLAVGLMVREAVAEVALLTVRLLTEMPAPNVAVVVF